METSAGTAAATCSAGAAGSGSGLAGAAAGVTAAVMAGGGGRGGAIGGGKNGDLIGVASGGEEISLLGHGGLLGVVDRGLLGDGGIIIGDERNASALRSGQKAVMTDDGMEMTKGGVISSAAKRVKVMTGPIVSGGATTAVVTGVGAGLKSESAMGSNLGMVVSATDDEFVTSTSSIEGEIRGWDTVFSQSSADTMVSS